MKKKIISLLLSCSILLSNYIALAEKIDLESIENYNSNLIESLDLEMEDEIIADKLKPLEELEKDQAAEEYEENIDYDDFFDNYFESENNQENKYEENFDENNYIYNYEEERNVGFEYFDSNIFESINNEDSNSGKIKSTKKGITLKYAFDFSNNSNLRFIETGIKVENSKINPSDLEGLLMQLSIKRNGILSLDGEHFILELDGETVSINYMDFDMDSLKEELIKIGVVIKAETSTTDYRNDLVDRFMVFGEVPVFINNEEISLLADSELRGNYVVFPIRNIVKGLDGEIEWNDNKGEVTITKEDKVIKLNDKSDIINVNGKNMKINVPSEVNDGVGRMLSLISLITEELGGIAYYDAQVGAVTIDY